MFFLYCRLPTVENDKSVEDRIAILDVLCNDDPVVHGHVAGVEKRVVLVDGVDDALVVGNMGQNQWQESWLGGLLAGIDVRLETDLQ